jgi:hypothetical protein
MKPKSKPVNLQRIFGLIKWLLSGVKRHFTGITSLPYARRYIVAAPILVLFFLVITFPLDVFVMKELKKQEGSQFKSIQIESLSISPFRNWTAKSVNISSMQRSDIALSGVNCSLSTIGLLRKRISGDLNIDSLSYLTDTVKASCALSIDSDISLDSVQYLPMSGNLSIELSNLAMQGLTLQGFNIPAVLIPKATLSSTFQSKVMMIKDCSITGKDLSGTIKGSITIDAVPGRSQLNLTIEIDSGSAMLKDYKLLLGSFINQSTGRLSISVQGAMQNPSVNMISQNATSTIAPTIKR